MHIPRGIRTPPRARHRREPHKNRRLLPGTAQERRGRDITPIPITRERAMRARTPRMHSPLRNLSPGGTTSVCLCPSTAMSQTNTNARKLQRHSPFHDQNAESSAER